MTMTSRLRRRGARLLLILAATLGAHAAAAEQAIAGWHAVVTGQGDTSSLPLQDVVVPAEGIRIADNDAGYVLLPDGRRYCIAVFVTESEENDAANAAIAAAVSRAAYEYFSSE